MIVVRRVQRPANYLEQITGDGLALWLMYALVALETPEYAL